MNSLEIDHLLHNNAITSKRFVGVFPPDGLPINKMKPGSMLVANLCMDQGCHWAAMSFSSKSIEVFDSSGLPTHVLNPHIANFIRRQGNKRVFFNKVQLQNMKSSTCGNHCCVYIYLKCLGFPMKKIVSVYSKVNLHENDKTVMKMFKQYF